MLKSNLFLLLAIFAVSSFTVFSQTENWKLYDSALAALSVKYPPDWKMTEDLSNQPVRHIFFVSPGVRDDDVTMTSSILICSQPKGHISTSSNSRSRCSQRDDHLSEIAKDKVISEEVLKINGLQIRKKITEDKYKPTATYIYAFFSSDDREFLVSSYFSRKFNLDKYIPVFDQILSTLQILGEKPTSEYKNENYDFALTYPNSWKSCSISAKTNQEEQLLILMPKGRACNGNNYISVSRLKKFSNEKNNRDLKEFLKGKVFTKIEPYVEFGNIHAALGENSDKRHTFRERYFYTNYPQTYQLLKITERFELNKKAYQKEAQEILTTARRFLKAR